MSLNAIEYWAFLASIQQLYEDFRAYSMLLRLLSEMLHLRDQWNDQVGSRNTITVKLSSREAMAAAKAVVALLSVVTLREV